MPFDKLVERKNICLIIIVYGRTVEAQLQLWLVLDGIMFKNLRTYIFFLKEI